MIKRTAVLAILGIALVTGPPATASDYAPYHYGRWIPVGPGHGTDIEFVRINPDDANVVLVSSDASGLQLTCDAGRTWSIVNHGLIYGRYEGQVSLQYVNSRPEGAIEWDPVDSNYVYSYHGDTLWLGTLSKGSPGRISWEYLDSIPSGTQWGGQSIIFDPVPTDPNWNDDPTHVGAQYFYLINRFGYIGFTDDGGRNIYNVARNPSFTGGQCDLFKGQDNPLLAVYPPTFFGRQNRVIMVPRPDEYMYAWAFHDQIHPDDANYNDPDPDVFWDSFDPELLIDPNIIDENDKDYFSAGSNGIRILNQTSYPVVLAADNSSSALGSIFTQSIFSASPWARRYSISYTIFDPNRPVFSGLVVDPINPNNCYVTAPRGNLGFWAGVIGTNNLWEPNDPYNTTWRELIQPNYEKEDEDSNYPVNIAKGHSNRKWLGCGWSISLAACDPNIIWYSEASVLAKSVDCGATWTQVYTSSDDFVNIDDPNETKDPNDTRNALWKNRGLFPVHVQSVAVAPSDPNIFYLSHNDNFGCFKTEDRGKTYRKFLNFSNEIAHVAPTEMRYCAGDANYVQTPLWFCLATSTSPPNDPNWWTKRIEADFRSGVVHPTDPNFAWFATFESPSVDCSLVIKTTDGAESLTIVQPDNAKWSDFDPSDPNDCDPDDPNDPNYWTKPRVHRLFTELAVDPNGTTLFLAAGIEGILKSASTDPNTLGDTWSTCLDPCAVVDNDDYDDSWFQNPDPTSFPNDPNYAQAPFFVSVDVADSDPNIVYCATGNPEGFAVSPGGYVYKSTDAGTSWRRMCPLGYDPNSGDPNAVSDPDYSGPIRKLVVHPSDSNIAYVACYDWYAYTNARPQQFGIWKTDDGGECWKKVFPRDPNQLRAYCRAVAIDPKDPNHIYVTNRSKDGSEPTTPMPGLYVSFDAGDTWRMLGDPDANSPDDPNYALCNVISSYYCLTFHPTTGDLYVGTPAGAYWWPRDRDLYVHHYPDQDPNDPNVVLANWGRVYIDGNEVDPNDLPHTYADGTQVTLDAVPEPNHYFIAWYDQNMNLLTDVDPCDPQITITLDKDRQVWALFSTQSCGSGMGFMAIPMMLATTVGLFVVRWRIRRRQ
ncbi:MAG: hypothetical protein JXQ73_13070 [Phycisphaerae bacterium]|nr:hypothetical protein [Phycisphaerae bacterium]